MKTTNHYKSKIATNGQVVIPKELRDFLNLKPGDVVSFSLERDDNGMFSVTVKKGSVQFSELVGAISELKEAGVTLK